MPSIARQVLQRCGTEPLDVGMDCVSVVCHDYVDRRIPAGLFPFTGQIQSVTLHMGDGPEVTGMDLLRMSVKMDQTSATAGKAVVGLKRRLK